MAAATGEVRECLRAHLIDVVRFLEGGNHDCDTFDYTLFRLDWVLNVLTRYLDTETTRADARLVHLVREAIEAVTDAKHSRNTDAFQSGSIFTGQRGRPKLEVIRTRWTKRASALVVSVSKYLVSTFNTQSNLNKV